MKPAIVNTRCWRIMLDTYGYDGETRQGLIHTIAHLRRSHVRLTGRDPGLRGAIAILVRVERDIMRRTR